MNTWLRALAVMLAVAGASACGDGDARTSGAAARPGTDIELSEERAARAELAIDSFGCTSCHLVPGIVGKEAYVGPPLEGVARRVYIAGVLENTPDNMTRWIQDPQDVAPLTAMPDLGVGEQDARDITAYLYERTGTP